MQRIGRSKIEENHKHMFWLSFAVSGSSPYVFSLVGDYTRILDQRLDVLNNIAHYYK
jgi:hypothetical protein